ncbi:MAG TPA: aldose epimerase family protein [Devosia sp.]|nr:aldose epimerase family protein [Devosia sp.]
MGISARPFGEYRGKPVEAFRLVSDTGAEVEIISYGAIVRSWQAPLPGAGKREVALGYESLEHYVGYNQHFGAIAGRVANRIAGASFTLDGQTYRLPANDHGNTLHGGPEGLGMQVWSAQPDEATNGLRLSFSSPDGAAGFPGKVDITASYRLYGNRLSLELAALPDRRTPIALVQHQYFNLGTTDDVLDHHFTINASARSEVDGDLVPTGAILPVKGGDYDFRTGHVLRKADGSPLDCDLNLVLATDRNPSDPIATVRGPDGALTLKLWSDRPAVQLYNSVNIRGTIPVPGLEGRQYRQYAGFCLEDQMYPDALHQPHFPSIIVSPEKPYRHFSMFEVA